MATALPDKSNDEPKNASPASAGFDIIDGGTGTPARSNTALDIINEIPCGLARVESARRRLSSSSALPKAIIIGPSGELISPTTARPQWIVIETGSCQIHSPPDQDCRVSARLLSINRQTHNTTQQPCCKSARD